MKADGAAMSNRPSNWSLGMLLSLSEDFVFDEVNGLVKEKQIAFHWLY